MTKIASKDGFGRVVLGTLCCAGAGMGLWLYASGAFVGASQNGGTMTVTGHESPFACSLEKSLTKEQREHKKQIALKMESARIETKELACFEVVMREKRETSKRKSLVLEGLPRSLHYAGRRSETEHRKNPARSGRDDWMLCGGESEIG